uniref:SH2 domain-containing protein n=1 Tax=Apteryx owenii TaxID=8824 RepID=A0A8B9S6B9_APTOW
PPSCCPAPLPLCPLWNMHVLISLLFRRWYHGAISRTDAENLLRLCKECSYLVRNSQTSKHDYSLSLNLSSPIASPVSW